jgi:membrane-bound lytic murein transglycosylase A
MSATNTTFEPVSFADLPGWAQDDHTAALRAFVASCKRLAEVQAHGSASVRLSPDLAAAFAVASQLSADTVHARRFFEASFVPHRVSHGRDGGLLTGYYEPVVDGSRTREGVYQVPLYRRPPDLVNLVDEAARGTVGTGLTHARATATGTEPYATRAEIESGALAGQGLELFYLADPVDLFFMQVQGAGRIRLQDGSLVRVTYDGKNGHPYTSIGRYLVDTGALPIADVTLESLARWLRADPERGRAVMWQNASYVFFRELTGDEAASAKGVHGIPLTPGRSLAVDTSVHKLGTPIYVVAPSLAGDGAVPPYQRLMIAQDVGSAIKGPERGDIYYGSGDEAGQRAGTTKHAGHFFVLLPRSGNGRP